MIRLYLKFPHAGKACGLPVTQSDMQRGSLLAAGSVQAVGDSVGGSSRNMAQPDCSRYCSSLVASRPVRDDKMLQKAWCNSRSEAVMVESLPWQVEH